uniref:Uncharacterized protein n=1 Tax=Fagus sylvatica TaxID=28930 RepID=A0A2N9GXA8_FAGSY
MGPTTFSHRPQPATPPATPCPFCSLSLSLLPSLHRSAHGKPPPPPITAELPSLHRSAHGKPPPPPITAELPSLRRSAHGKPPPPPISCSHGSDQI